MHASYPPDDVIHIYSIHAWKYGERRSQLHDLLSPAWVKGEDYFDLSVPAEHPLDCESAREIGHQLTDRIQKSDVVLIMAGMYLINRFWMEFEIVTAFVLGKPIIPVAYNGQTNIPDMARRFMSCEEPLRWRSASIIEEVLSWMASYRRDAFDARRACQMQDILAALAPPSLSPLRAGRPIGALESYDWTLPALRPTPPPSSLFDFRGIGAAPPSPATDYSHGPFADMLTSFPSRTVNQDLAWLDTPTIGDVLNGVELPKIGAFGRLRRP